MADVVIHVPPPPPGVAGIKAVQAGQWEVQIFYADAAGGYSGQPAVSVVRIGARLRIRRGAWPTPAEEWDVDETTGKVNLAE